MTGIGFLIMTVSKFGVAGAFTVGVTKAIDYFHTFDKRIRNKQSLKRQLHQLMIMKQSERNLTKKMFSS